MQKKVTKKVGHDNLFIDAKYATGGRFRFSIGRGGERILLGGASGEEGKRQLMVLNEWTKFRSGETNGERIDRIHAACAAVENVADLVKIAEAAPTVRRPSIRK